MKTKQEKDHTLRARTAFDVVMPVDDVAEAVYDVAVILLRQFGDMLVPLMCYWCC
jgi:hypothetical protein